MTSRRCHQVSVGTILRRDGRYLLLRSGNEWGIVGGWLEAGEDVYQGLAREIREETQVEAEILTAIDAHTYLHPERGPVVSIIFISTHRGGEVRLSHEHESYRWCSADEILSGQILLGYPSERGLFAKAFRLFALYDG